MTSALQRAIDALKIEDVSIRSTSASVAEEFEPRLDPRADELEVALKHEVTGYETIEIEPMEGPTRTLFRVLVDLGVRWSEPSEERDAHDKISEDANDVVEVAVIRATMVAEYAMRESPGEDALTQFALENASFHVWPYWREYVASQCYRMNLPRFMLPTRQFAQEPPEEGD